MDEMILLTLAASLAILHLAAASSNDTGVSNCTYARYFSFEGGNLTCPDSAPVLSYIQTTAPAGQNEEHLPSTNWTMWCSCPQWSLDALNPGAAESHWRPFNDSFKDYSNGHIQETPSGHFECGVNGYLSGLAYEFNSNCYFWWGRCTEFPPGYRTSALQCWESDTTLSQGSDGVVHTPDHTVVIRRIDIEYPLAFAALRNIYRVWTYTFCLVRSVECIVPAIDNGFTELSPATSDFYTGLPAKVKSNETVQIYCNEGHYMDGPNSSTCQPDGEWTQVPTCEACKSIYRCRVIECSDGRVSFCAQCKAYTRRGLKVLPNHNRKKCRVVPYIYRTEATLQLFVYQPGDTLRLDCPAEGTPTPTIEWRSYTQNNASVSQVVDVALLRSFSNGSLEIQNLTSEAEGVYSCTASNSVGSDWLYVFLINQYSNRFEHQQQTPIIFNQTEVPFFFPENEPAFLHCRTNGIPPPLIRWSRRDPSLRYYLPAYGDLRVHIYDNGTLAFYPIRASDSGVYTCEAVNDYGGDVASFIVCVGDSCGGTAPGDVIPPLEVFSYPPFIVKWTHVYFIEEGESFSLSCVAGGNPDPIITWRHSNTIISYGRTHLLTNLTLDDTGIYECIAKNYVGKDKRKVAIIVYSKNNQQTSDKTNPGPTSYVPTSSTSLSTSIVSTVKQISATTNLRTSIIIFIVPFLLSLVCISFL